MACGEVGRLLICCVNYAPEILGTAPYTRDTAEWFAARGWDVRVVTTYPYYPEWRRRAGDPRLGYRRERAGGVTVWRCPTYVPAAPTGPRRLAHFASFAASSLPVVLAHAAWRPDFILVVAPTLAGAPGALLAARLSGACSWLHVQDYEVDVALRLGLLPPAARAPLKRLESTLLRAFDAVTSITQPMLDAAARGGRPGATGWCSCPTGRTSPPCARWTARRASAPSSGIPAERPVALYSGNLGRKQGVAMIGDAARRSQDGRIARRVRRLRRRRRAPGARRRPPPRTA